MILVILIIFFLTLIAGILLGRYIESLNYSKLSSEEHNYNKKINNISTKELISSPQVNIEEQHVIRHLPPKQNIYQFTQYGRQFYIPTKGSHLKYEDVSDFSLV